MNSVAEVELLSQVAAMLMPEAAPIAEMFRDFPAPEGWGGNHLGPDLSLHGVLKNKDAALFVEYDGYWRHGTKEGMARDEVKNEALLAHAPAGSYVIRVSHTTSRPLEDNIIWMKVDTWSQGNSTSLQKVLMDLLVQIRSSGLSHFLHPSVANRLKLQAKSSAVELSLEAQELACSAVVVGASNASDEIGKFLAAEGFRRQEIGSIMKPGAMDLYEEEGAAAAIERSRKALATGQMRLSHDFRKLLSSPRQGDELWRLIIAMAWSFTWYGIPDVTGGMEQGLNGLCYRNAEARTLWEIRRTAASGIRTDSFLGGPMRLGAAVGSVNEQAFTTARALIRNWAAVAVDECIRRSCYALRTELDVAAGTGADWTTVSIADAEAVGVLEVARWTEGSEGDGGSNNGHITHHWRCTAWGALEHSLDGAEYEVLSISPEPSVEASTFLLVPAELEPSHVSIFAPVETAVKASGGRERWKGSGGRIWTEATGWCSLVAALSVELQGFKGDQTKQAVLHFLIGTQLRGAVACSCRLCDLAVDAKLGKRKAMMWGGHVAHCRAGDRVDCGGPGVWQWDGFRSLPNDEHQMLRALRLFRPRPSSRSAASLPAAPGWWQRGWRRDRVGSLAEAEILAPLAETLMPQMPIAELFRSFPSPEGWGGYYLEPDLTAYGVLKDTDAALFVEYDGYWRHGEKEGVKLDMMKNAALLRYAPKGSHVIRISHTMSQPLRDKVIWIRVERWRSGRPKLAGKICCDILTQTMKELNQCLHPDTVARLSLQAHEDFQEPSATLRDFINVAVATRDGNTMDDMTLFLKTQGFWNRDVDSILERAVVGGVTILAWNYRTRIYLSIVKAQVRGAVHLGCATAKSGEGPPNMTLQIGPRIEPKHVICAAIEHTIPERGVKAWVVVVGREGVSGVSGEDRGRTMVKR
eukprot:Skav226405  [mRNA]  locus=scaffold3989:211395:227176:- [translate_table: standard]